MGRLHRILATVSVLVALATPARGEDEIRLEQGDVIRGEIVEITDAAIIVDHPDLGRLTIPLKNVASHSRIEEAEPDVSRSEPTAIEEEIDDLIEKKKVKWNFTTSLGGTVTNDDEGQTVKFNLRSTASRKTDRWETMFRASWIYSFDDRVTDENTFILRASHSRKFGDSRWFGWLSGRYDYDDFRDWRQRVTAHLGPGFELIKKPKFDLSLYAGLGGRKEFGSANEDFIPEAALGVSSAWRPRERQAIVLSVFGYPAFENDDYRVITSFDWTVLIDRRIGMSFNTHLDWEYDTSPDPGFPPNTLRWTWGFQFTY
ncbi:MAG: DUF481 domain-containing protein [Planctomycetota bacterium]|jgi:hypothetical protein